MLNRGFVRQLSTACDHGAGFRRLLEYSQTPKVMIPLLYRRKNEQLLRAKGLVDNNNKALKSRGPLKLPSKTSLSSLLLDLKTEDELRDCLKEWRRVKLGKKSFWQYFSPEHLQIMVIVGAFKLNNLGKTLDAAQILRPTLMKAGNGKIYDIEHWCNTALMCQLHLNAALNLCDSEFAVKKMNTLWNSTNTKESKSGLFWELLKCLERQQNVEFSISEEYKVPISLPNIDLETLTPGKMYGAYKKYRYLYLQARTAVEFGSTNEKVITFSKQFKELANRISIKDFYLENIEAFENLHKKPTSTS
ncbi:HBL085Cp [Eremothecium sinecaudum]|uniref:HBL085Cp n=1 Tax=Eremothecium sinecaudum TaxID=45286 RepID=A0A109UX89_9SACH|nr:HBL085Cp [Eremothecium sinecaudum]AMD18817.1 HBL085Cp [Eremothecium sinecaudum]